MVQSKHQIEAALAAENQDIKAGRLKEESPLDLSENFRQLCEASRRGDLKTCQEKISQGANINARDRFDYTPLILVGQPPERDIQIMAAPQI
jgi:ankyrin repeat and BTB/POZ domain-containing protein 1